MSSIADALKRAQQERDRLKPHGHAPATREPAVPAPPSTPPAPAEPSLASVVLRRTPQDVPANSPGDSPTSHPAAAAAPHVPAMPLTTAVRQSPPLIPPAARNEQRAAETIVEDYSAKQRLNLPAQVVVYHERAGAIAAQYRKMRDNLMAPATTGGALPEKQVLVLTSSVPGEGKTTTALNLALALAEIRANHVLLIDGSLHTSGRPTSLTDLLHLDHERGLAELLAAPAAAATSTLGTPHFDPAALQPFLKATPWHNLFVLPSGARTTPAAAAQLLQTPTLRTVLRHLRPSFDWIIIDAPAATRHPDAGLLGAFSDGMLVTVALRKTPLATVQTTLRRLRSMSLPVKSCILTHA